MISALEALIIVQPQTVIKWHREGVRLYWRWKSRAPVGRPKIDLEIRELIRHDRREVIHFNVTEHPTVEWAGQQIIGAFPEDTAPRFLLRDRDQIYGEEFRRRVKGREIEEVITAPHSPWQNAYAERLIGSLRRECLNHVIIFNEDHLRRILREYFDYYHHVRPHQSLERNSPVPREIEPQKMGHVISMPRVGDLHHCYRRAA